VLALQAELQALDKQHSRSLQAQLQLQAEVRELRAEREGRVREAITLRRALDKLLAERQAAATAQARDAAYIRQLESRLAALDVTRVGSAARRRSLARSPLLPGPPSSFPDHAVEAVERERARSRALAENLLDANEAAAAAAAEASAAAERSQAAEESEAAARAAAAAAAEQLRRLELQVQQEREASRREAASLRAALSQTPAAIPADPGAGRELEDLRAGLAASRAAQHAQAEAQGRLERELGAVREAAAQLASSKATDLNLMRMQLEAASSSNAALEAEVLRLQQNARGAGALPPTAAGM